MSLEIEKRTILIIQPKYLPQRCGVSDYCEVLITGLIKKNYTIVQVALYQVTVSIQELVHEQEQVITYLIPQETKLNRKYTLLKQIVDKHQPIITYFNFTPQGYHRYGLCVWLLVLPKVISSTSNYIVLHEIWTGLYFKDNWKKKFLGIFQKIILRAFLRKIKGNIVTTSFPYQNILRNSGFTSKVVEVFSNVHPFTEVEYDNKISYGNCTGQTSQGIEIIFFGNFSLCHEGESNFIKFLKSLSQLPQAVKFKRIGKRLSAKYETLIEQFGLLVNLGYLSNEQVRKQLLTSSFCISDYDSYSWTKSGSIAACLACGLPVLLLGVEPKELLNTCKTTNTLLTEASTIEFDAKTYISQIAGKNTEPDRQYNERILERLTSYDSC